MLVAVLIVVAVLASGAAARSTSWFGCGTVRQAPVGGYVLTADVQARDGVSCALARHIALHFHSGGYYYRGLTCFYAAMGTHTHWNWSCARGTPGREVGTRSKVRAHEVSTRAPRPPRR
ncbi:MAG: hypothetical protein ACR2IP_11750 [Solirubrobacteraceae bacterium]